MRPNLTQNIFLLLGLFCLFGGIAWILVLSHSIFITPENRESFYEGKELTYYELNVPSNSRVTVRYATVQSANQIESLILDRQSFNKLRIGNNVSVNPLARSFGSQDVLKVNIPIGEQLFIVFKPIYAMDSLQYNRTILKEHKLAYYPSRLENGTRLNIALTTLETDDTLRLMIINQSVLDRILEGRMPPEKYGYAEKIGTGQLNMSWTVKGNDPFYVLVLPISENWPVPYLITLAAFKVEGKFPIDFTYQIEYDSEGDWILGLIPMIFGTALIIGDSALKTRKKRNKQQLSMNKRCDKLSSFYSLWPQMFSTDSRELLIPIDL